MISLEDLSPEHLTVHRVTALSSEDIYYESYESPAVWRTEHFEKTLPFYPVYRWRDHYAHVPLYLILKKGYLNVDRRAERISGLPDFRYNLYVIDSEIEDLPDRVDYTREIGSSSSFALQVAEAMKRDVRDVERRVNPRENLILCGGKDSLNLLLLPWQNPVRVLSARPSYRLVKQFVRRNDLNFSVSELKDAVDVRMRKEIVINACMNDLAHCRWTGHLRQIVRSTDRSTIVWKGQLGDVLLTKKWRSYDRKFHPDFEPRTLLNSLRSLGVKLNIRYQRLRRLVDPQGYFFRQLWKRGAHWQGAHMAFLKEMTGALVLSGYHGKHVTDTLRRTDYTSAVTHDLRPAIGRALLGGDVWYPRENPGPPRSEPRAGVSTAERFRAEIERLPGLSIE